VFHLGFATKIPHNVRTFDRHGRQSPNLQALKFNFVKPKMSAATCSISVETEGVCIGCLICSDAYDFVGRYRVGEKVESPLSLGKSFASQPR
jgi:hypothetical protein